MAGYPGTSSAAPSTSSLFDNVGSDTVCYKLDALSVSVEMLNKDWERLREAFYTFQISQGMGVTQLAVLLVKPDDAAFANEKSRYADDLAAFKNATQKLPASVYQGGGPQALIDARTELAHAWNAVKAKIDGWETWRNTFRDWFASFYPKGLTGCTPFQTLPPEQIQLMQAKENEYVAWRKTYEAVTGAAPSQPYTATDIAPKTPAPGKSAADAIADAGTAIGLGLGIVGGVWLLKTLGGR